MKCINLIKEKRKFLFNILFILRIDAKEKNGGDLYQAKQYKKALDEEFSDDVSIQFAHDISMQKLLETKWDLVQLFNVSRLDEHIFYLSQIKYQYLAMTPIVQPNYMFSFKEYLKSLIRGVLYFKVIPYNSNGKKYNLLSKCDFNVFLSQDEQNYYEKNFVKINNSVIAKNGVDLNLTKPSVTNEKEIDFLVVGRVEKSKNTLNTLKMLNEYFPNFKSYFIGAGNKYHFRYFKKFLQKCDKNENVKYLGLQSHEKVTELMSNAKILLNLSLKEVSPLVDLEALACDMKVLSTTVSFTHLKEDGCFMRVDPLNEESIVEKIKLLVESKCKKNNQILVWKDTLRSYIQKIDDLIKEKK